MAKNTVGDWDGTTAGNNTDVGGISLAEGSGGMRVPATNNAFREIMKQVKAAIGVTIQAYSAGLTAIASAFTAASSSGPASLAFAEDTDNGSNKITVSAPASLGGDIALTLPATAGTLMSSGAYPTLVSLEGITIAAGTLVYGTAADTVAALGIGTALQVLRTNAGATAPEWATISTNAYTLLGTLTTTSGTTAALTSIAAGYREFYCELEGVSWNAGDSLQLALSSTNGSSYGTAQTVSGSSASGGGALSGVLRISNVSSTVAAAKAAHSAIAAAAGAASNTVALLATDTAAVVDAIRFSSVSASTFDGGTIRVYGVK